ncbi:hypothetical protein ACH5RR_014930 [Cinchona calisaya]|uniref:Receptor-like serine/threonine-protein kinase n=1 Tax=Cinchona calisaya TaxID=153742 RepID=A0ABD2ZRQ7_9GENT
MGFFQLVFVCCTFTFLASYRSIATTDTLAPLQTLTDGQILVSSNQKFALGFFSPGNSSKRYLGIWFHNLPLTVVWVANKGNPINESSGWLTIYSNGALFLYNSSVGSPVSVVWSTNETVASKNPVLQVLGSGNLVVREQETNGHEYIWQSFDYVCDTLLPGMKLGWKLRSNTNRYMTSWKSSEDLSDGDFTFSLDPPDVPQLVLRRRSKKEFRQYPFAGYKFSGGNEVENKTLMIKPVLVSNIEEVYYSYEMPDDSALSRLLLTQRGSVQFLMFQNLSREWRVVKTVNEDYCDQYGTCGPYGNCFSEGPNCRCLQRFLPRVQQDWRLSDWSGGCMRRYELNCSSTEGFVKYDGLNLPDNAVVRANYTLDHCRMECVNKCDCMAYTTINVNGNDSQCMMWLGALVDLRNIPNGGEELYIRMASLELGSDSNNKRRNIKLIVAITTSTASVLILCIFLGLHIYRLKRRTPIVENQTIPAPENSLCGHEQEKSREEVLEFSFFDLATISAATDQFALQNKIGEGGFGPVYKGALQNGMEIAVKRLSKKSGQGVTEFTNEVTLIAKLQHRNLVWLLGCCIHEEERMLIYEYLPNKSLDNLIFDETKRKLLQWDDRFEIILGIARGLLYIHQDSRFTIIHRDLKTSNILLDNEMIPKISDFGIARISGTEETIENSNRIMGTLGYISPEYARTGDYSIKSDIFSLGVILLEIISGRKNWGFHHSEHNYNLLGHAWKLWNEGKALEIVDELLEGSYSLKEVMRCIQVALLCGQNQAEERPKMCGVVFMLMNENAELPQPKEPGFWSDSYGMKNIIYPSSCTGEDSSTGNELTFTTMEGR